MSQTWTVEDFSQDPKKTWSANDFAQSRPDPIDLRSISTGEVALRLAAERIEYYQRDRDQKGEDRLTANEQIAIQDSYRQLAGLSPENYYLTKQGAVPKDRFYEVRAQRTQDSPWQNFQNNVANTLIQSIGGLTTVGGKVTDTLQITDDAVEEWSTHLDETARILAPQRGISGALGQLVGTTMFSLLGGIGGAGRNLNWAGRIKQAVPIASMFGVSAAGQTFGEVAQRRLEGQNIGMLNEWTAATSNAMIETGTELFGWAAARHLAGGLVRQAPGLRRALAKGGWQGAKAWLGGFTKNTIGHVLADAPQGYVEEFLAQVGQDTTNKILGITPEIEWSEFLQRSHEAGQMGAAQVLLLGGSLAAAGAATNRLGPSGPPEGAVLDDGKPNVPIGPEMGLPRRQPTTAELPSPNQDFAVRAPGTKITGAHDSYTRASAIHREGTAMPLGYENVYVRQTSEGDNADRVLLVQWSSPLLTQREDANTKTYHDKVYDQREGYERLDDFWEVPQWIGRAAHAFPNSDVYVVRNPDEALNFFQEAGYGQIAFSVLDTNKALVQNVVDNYNGRVVVGGYADLGSLAQRENVTQYDDIGKWAEAEQQDTTEGYNYRHFQGARTIPRLSMSEGCIHKCAFCTVPHTLKEISQETIDQQADALVDLDARLVYMNDKTFGQAENHTYLKDLHTKLKERNPNFQGFIVQTTASQLVKLDSQFLKDAGVRYVELGVETFNDPILKKMHKPTNEKQIDGATEKLRQANISLIPNFIIGLPDETAETYGRSLEWIGRNADVISHLNIYNLALYEGTELGGAVKELSEGDLDENQVARSYHKDPALHQTAAAQFYELGRGLLDQAPVSKPKTLVNEAMEIGKTSDVRKAAQMEQTLPDELQEEIPATEVLPDVREPGSESAQALTDTWTGDLNVAHTRADLDAARKQGALKQLVRKGETVEQVDRAMHLYIDMKNAPSEYSAARIAGLAKDRQAEIRAVSELSSDQIGFVERIIQENQELGRVAQDQGLLTNFLENYSARLWKTTKEIGRWVRGPKFALSTGRQRHRILGSIIAGWEQGLELRVPGVIEAQRVARRQIAQVIADRNIIELGLKNGLFSLEREGDDWQYIKHPTFQKWTWAGKAEEGKAYGAGVFVSPDGNLFHRVPVYAQKRLARHMNNVLGSSALYEWPGVGTLTKYNAIIKSAILIWSLYHHQAYLRSYMLGSRRIDPVKAYQEGREAVDNFIPEVELGVHEGLTIGRVQDFNQLALQEKTAIGKVIDQVPMAKESKDLLIKMRDHQIDFLFHKMGPYLKTYAYLIDYRARVKANRTRLVDGRITHREIAAAVASELNNDFGGLNLQKLGRNPTLQHAFQLLALAPDWTESNIRSFTDMFKQGEVGKVHRLMWGRIALKGFGLIILSNLMLSGFDDETFWSRYQKAWKAGNLKWMDVDITPVYRALGGEDGKRKYFNLLGHFRDPLKFTVHPVRSAKGKGSVLTRLALDAVTGEDWQGRKYTSVGELLRKGEVTKWDAFGGSTLEWGQLPSFLVWQAKQSTPIQMQAGIDWTMGSIDGWDAITRSLGIMGSGTKEPSVPKLRRKRRKVQRKRQK